MIRSILLFTFLVVASVGFTADVMPVDVTVSGQDGKVAFKGKTDAKGAFSTREPRSWELHRAFLIPDGLLHGQYAIVVSAGKKKTSADAVDGEKFTKGGVAMKVDVSTGVKIAGRVAPSGGEVKPGMVWIPKKLGSNKAAHWAPADSAEAKDAQGFREHKGTGSAGYAIQGHQRPELGRRRGLALSHPGITARPSSTGALFALILPAEGLEPTHSCEVLDFESSASANSATPAAVR